MNIFALPNLSGCAVVETKKQKKKTRKQRINAICEYPKADPYGI